MDVLRFPPTDTRPPSDAIVGLDAVRALAALGVVLLHSCVPYLQHPMPGLAWAVQDASSIAADVAFWWIELFIMPLFLTVAGFFTWRSLTRRGGWALVSHRARRLLWPLAFGVVAILPLDLYVWVLGWVSEGLVPPVKLKSLKFDAGLDRHLWGLSHLWFLQYLFLYVVTVAIIDWIVRRIGSPRKTGANWWVMMGVWMMIGTLVLYLHPEVVWGFQHSFFPVPSKWIYSGLFFAGGLLLALYDAELRALAEVAGRLVVPSIAVSAAAVLLGRWHLDGNTNQLAGVTLAGLTCGGAALLTAVVIGIAVKRVQRLSPPLQYLAAASFWVYLVHHPLLGLVQIDLKWLLPTVHPAAKTLLAFAVTSAASLLTYEGFVRRTALGRLLGMSWRPTGLAESDSTVLAMSSDDLRATEMDEASRRNAA